MRSRAGTRRTLRGFRGRLALSIAATFVVLGASLVSVQVVILSQSISRTVDVSIGSGVQRVVPPAESTAVTDVADCVSTPGSVDCQIDVPVSGPREGRLVASDVMRTYVTWTVVLLVVFAVVSAVLAWLLTRSPARKISHVTDLAETFSERDLSRRIALTGPRDEITDLGDRINTMLGRLEDAFTSQEQFVANASHELRTPITAVRAALEAPLAQGRVPADLQPYIHRALRSNQRMDDLITALLVIARSRRLETDQLERVDLAALVRRELLQARPGIEGRGLSVAIAGTDRPVIVDGGSEPVAIAIRNLVRNAIQHNRDGGWIDVRLGERHVEEKVVLVVSNSGTSYADDEIGDLTLAFNRGRRTRLAGTPGTGLGLAIVESIVTAHGGELGLRPGAPDGLVVSLTLPRASR